MEDSDGACGDGDEFASWAENILRQIRNSEATCEDRIKAAATLAENAIHLHDGKDYIDDAMPLLEPLLRDSAVPLEARCFVAVGIVRLLAHGWEWDEKANTGVVNFAASVICDAGASLDAKHAAVLAISQLFEPDNDSDTEQEEKTTDKVAALIAKGFACVQGAPREAQSANPPERDGDDEGGERSSQRQRGGGAAVLDSLGTLLKGFLSSGHQELAEVSSSLLAQLPAKKKRGRHDRAQTAVETLCGTLRSAVDRRDRGGACVALKGLNKILIEAAFEAIEDLEEDEGSKLAAAVPHLEVLSELIASVLTTIAGKAAFDSTERKDEQACADKHFCLATTALTCVLCIRALGKGGAAPSDEAVKRLASAWNAHRFHTGEEFEMIESAVARVAEKFPKVWESVPMDPVWVCFNPKQSGVAAPGNGFSF